VTDGVRTMANVTPSIATIIPYDVLSTTNLITSNGWIVNNTIITENECTTNNLATAIIQSEDIIDCIDNQVIKSGNGS
jgi:hypothetical protein